MQSVEHPDAGIELRLILLAVDAVILLGNSLLPDEKNQHSVSMESRLSMNP